MMMIMITMIPAHHSYDHDPDYNVDNPTIPLARHHCICLISFEWSSLRYYACVLSISTNVNNSCSKFLLHHKCNPGQLRTTITIQSQNKESSSNSRGVFLINANLIIIS